MNYSLEKTPLGWLALVAGDDGLLALTFRAERDAMLTWLAEAYPLATEGATPLLREAMGQVQEYLSGERRQFELPCDLSACSPFMRHVLGELTRVGYAELVSYGELARRAGAEGAARAIGRVMAKNPLPLIIPCHRVVGADGRLTGYSGGSGLASKSYLLAFERDHSPS